MDETISQSSDLHDNKKFYLVLVIVVIVMIFTGGLMFVKQNNRIQETRNELRKEFLSLQNQVSQIDQKLDEIVKSNSDEVEQATMDNFISYEYGLSFNVPTGFYVSEDYDNLRRIFISEEPIEYPDIGGTNAPISISRLNRESLNTELENIENRQESTFTIQGFEAKRIEGMVTDVFDKNLKHKLILVVVEDKDILVRGFEYPGRREISFDLEEKINEIVNSLRF